tara:strand:- start:108 stop:398 length:291 start_codon:yes stop_codon:yes gene_type:complete
MLDTLSVISYHIKGYPAREQAPKIFPMRLKKEQIYILDLYFCGACSLLSLDLEEKKKEMVKIFGSFVLFWFYFSLASHKQRLHTEKRHILCNPVSL